MGKHIKQALPTVYTLQCLTGKVDNNNNNKMIIGSSIGVYTIQYNRSSDDSKVSGESV